MDAIKTGEWEPIPKAIKEKVQYVPDFMMKPDKPSYPSKNILGQMYRMFSVFEDICNVKRLPMSDTVASTVQNLLQLEGIEAFLDDARRLRCQYNGELKELMEMYCFTTEGEFMSGCIEQLHEKMGKYMGENCILFSELRKNLKKKYMDLFLKVSPQDISMHQ